MKATVNLPGDHREVILWTETGEIVPIASTKGRVTFVIHRDDVPELLRALTQPEVLTDEALAEARLGRL